MNSSEISSRMPFAPSSRNASRGSVMDVGVGTPARPTIVFAVGLSQASRDALASEPT